jgi:2-(1,2-epoxy-1,2-dihydrophenyl)acetyl-CoA isomerase
MGPEQIRITREDDLAIVTMDDPKRRNALGSAGARAVAEAISEAARGARIVILTGSGPAFCAGGDLDELDRWSTQPLEDIGQKLYGSFQSMIRTIRGSDAIVIAAVNGAAVGAGMDLALACDLRVMARSARFGQVWVRLGVIPGTGGAWLTTFLAGPTRAAELLLTGDLIDAERALEYGLVNEVVEDDDLSEAARRTAERILRHPRDGVVENKRAYIAASQDRLEAALEHAARIQPHRFTSDEFKDALKKTRRS